MAAPFKTGLDYYPVDVDMLSDSKFIKAKTKYGYLSTIIYIGLLELIYKDKGYYLDYDEETVIWNIMSKLQGKYCPQENLIREVVECLVSCGLFSREHYAQKILTSRRIQLTYYRAVLERRNVHVDPAIWLLSLNEMKEISDSNTLLDNFVNRQTNEINRPNNSTNREVNIPNDTKEEKEENREKIDKMIRYLGEKYTLLRNISMLSDLSYQTLNKLIPEIVSSKYLQNADVSWIISNLNKVLQGDYRDIVSPAIKKLEPPPQELGGEKLADKYFHEKEIYKNFYDDLNDLDNIEI